ncbi:MAG: hypothetical protein AB7F59_05355 [Bdellovibrionales bacterium]
MFLFLVISFCYFALPDAFAQRANFDTLQDIKLSEIENIIQKNKVFTVEDLLGVLPQKYLEGYTLLYGSRSLQEASLEYPRAIVTGKTARTIIAFNGHHGQRGYNEIEVIEFNEVKKKFDFAVISFSPNASSKPTIDKNPSTCVACHRSDSRPNWATYGFWAGAYGSQHSAVFGHNPPEEVSGYKKLETKGRYKFLKYQGFIGPEGINRNSFLGKTMSYRNMQRISRIIQESPSIHKYRFTILAALVCISAETDIEYYLPPSTPTHSKDVVWYADDLLQKRLDLKTKKINFFKRFLNGSVFVDRAYLNEITPNRYGNIEFLREATLRYIVEGLAGESMADWSMELEPESYGFSDGGSLGIEQGYPGVSGTYHYGIQAAVFPIWEWIKPEMPRVELPIKPHQLERKINYSAFCHSLKSEIQKQ